ncbi:MAG: chromate resistance protein [Pseudomonadota bacterium]|nr:chromate resistance protein [Pseudomonadota bacterium]
MQWLLLILSLPTENASTRMRAWRALKGTGAAALRDGVYLLPESAERHALFSEVADDIEAAGGQAWLLATETPEAHFATLFDRTDDYRRLAVEIQDCLASLASHSSQENARLARKLRKNHVALTAIDFFPGEARRQVLAQLDTLDQRLQARMSPGEPTPRQTEITRLDPAAYQGRVWATRARPWVDRMASAWLIQRFIDRQARFLWLATPADCPAEALGFDFDGARFSHTGNRVSFETLMASFGLEGDAALNKLAELVHFLDVGGLPVAEAAGLETLLAGMRASLADDDALLAAASQAFDFLYTHYLNTGEIPA